MCFGSGGGQQQQPPPPPPPPAPPPPPPIDNPMAPILNEATKASTNARRLAAGQRRGSSSLRIDMNTGSGGASSNGLAIPT